MVSAKQRNAAAKLKVIYPNLEYLELSEKKIRGADLTAFIVAIIVEGRTYVGVGKTKKEARCEAAEKALRHLRLWNKEDEKNKRMVLYGIDEEDPVEVVMKLRAAAGLPVSFEEWNTPPILSNVTSPWEDSHPSGGIDDYDDSSGFNSHGPAPTHFHGPDFRPSMLPPRGGFNGGPPAPRPECPPFRPVQPIRPPRPVRPAQPPAFGRGYGGERFNQPNPGRAESSFSQGLNRVGPSQPSFRRACDAGSVPQPPRGRGNTSLMMRGIPRAQDGVGRAENRKIPPPITGRDRGDRFRPPVPERMNLTSHHAAIEPHGRLPSHSKIAGSVQPQPNISFAGQSLPSPNVAPVLRRTVTKTCSSATPVSSTAVGSVRASSMKALMSVPGSSSVVHRQQPATTVTTPVYPSTAISANNASNTALCGDQYNMMNAWQGATQTDYFAYYNSYLQNMGMSDVNSYGNLPVSTAANNTLPSSNAAAQSDMAYASQAAAYANAAAAYYNTFYGAGGYTDPNQSQLYNYLYSYNNSSTT